MTILLKVGKHFKFNNRAHRCTSLHHCPSASQFM